MNDEATRSGHNGLMTSRTDARLRAIGMGLAIVGVVWLVASIGLLQGALAWGYDYQAYADAAVRLAETGTLYQDETLAGPFRPGPQGLYLYAPPLGVAVSPLNGLPIDAAVLAWFLVHVAALAIACALMPVPVGVRLATFGIACISRAVSHDMVIGNVSVLLLLPMAAAWRWLDRPAGSVATAVAIAIRPMLGILLIWQLLRRQWRAVVWTVAAGLVLIVLTLPFVGIGGYLDYLTVLRNLGDVSGVEFNYDLSSVAISAGLGEPGVSMALMAGYAIAVVAIVASLRRDREVGFMVCLSASLLLSPLLWGHYLAVLVLPAAFLVSRGRPWALLLPMLSWLPGELLPFVAILGTLLPFVARDVDANRESRQSSPTGLPGRSRSAVPRPSP